MDDGCTSVCKADAQFRELVEHAAHDHATDGGRRVGRHPCIYTQVNHRQQTSTAVTHSDELNQTEQSSDVQLVPPSE